MSAETSIQAARGIYARHRRRTDGLPRCAFCSGSWHHTTTASGLPIDGCAARQLAGRALDDAGQLDATGHPTLPDTVAPVAS